MRLLFLSPQLPWPLVSGARLRVYHLLRAAAREHRVDLLSFADDGPSASVPMELRELCGTVELVSAPPRRSPLARVLGAALSPLPDLAERLWSAEMRQALANRLASQRYDAVQACGLEMGRYLMQVRGPRRILDEFNAEYLLQRSAARTDLTSPSGWPAVAYSAAQVTRLRAFEAALCRHADLVLAVSDEDAVALRELAPATPIHIVPNGVDPGSFPFHEPGTDCQPTLLFTGSMDYRPNDDAALWFVQRVLPLVKARLPEVRFFVVGHRPRPALVDSVRHDTAIAVTGGVDALEPYWDAACLYVLPMRMGGGVRFKAMEALSLGLPLVSTTFGMQGIAARPEHEYLNADTPETFAAAIFRLLEDAALRLRLARAGRELVEQRYAWRHVEPRLLHAYAELSGEPAVERPGG